MPRVCTACAHPDRDILDRSLVRGEPLRRIAAAHGLSESALHRHESAHLPAALAAAEDARRSSSADSLLGESLALQAKALDLMAQAEAQGDVRAAVVALKEARECVELRARIGAELGMADTKTADPRSFRVVYVSPKREVESASETLDPRSGTLAEPA